MLDLKSATFPVTALSFVPCWWPVQFCFRYSRHSVGSCTNKRFKRYKVEARCLHASLISRTQNIPSVVLSSMMKS